jgi:hypothetical protein
LSPASMSAFSKTIRLFIKNRNFLCKDTRNPAIFVKFVIFNL